MEVYIDESGDAGTAGNGTRWLVFGGATCLQADKDALESLVQELCGKIGRSIHCNELTHRDLRGISETLGRASSPWQGLVVASDTTALLPNSGLQEPQKQYNYALGYMLQRVSQIAYWAKEDVTVYIEMRRPSNSKSMWKYLQIMKTYHSHRFHWKHFSYNRIHFVGKGSHVGLGVADVLAHAALKAIEPDERWGHVEPVYLSALEPKLYRSSLDRLSGFGVTVMPTPLHALSDVFPTLTEPEK